MFDSDFFGNDFFTQMVYPEGILPTKHSLRCPQCGMTYNQFNRSGKFGCDHCYDTFSDQIKPLVKRLQGSLAYVGRVPSRGNGVFRTKYQIKRLRQELDQAIRAENFEAAVTLRDQIRTLEESLQR